MKLKSPGDEPVQVALLSSHCLVVYPEGPEVPPMFRKEAFKQGCIPVGVGGDEVSGPPEQEPNKGRMEMIKDTVKKMLEADCKLTGAGLPNLKELSKETGFPVTAVELGEVWKELEEEAQT